MAVSVSGKLVFLTGASSGIGAALAVEYAKRGAKLALTARRRDLLEKVKNDCEKLGATVAVYQCDVVHNESVQKTVAAVYEQFGQIDIVIANAGVSGSFKVEKLQAEAATQIIDVNVNGLINTIAAVLPYMLKLNSGTIVGISSLASYISFPQSYIYCASKSAASAILRGLRLELMKTNIQVTTICPGYIRTDMTAANRFHMPFLMDVDVAAKRIVNAVQRGDAVYDFPRRMRWVIRLLSMLPASLIAMPFRSGKSLKEVNSK